MTFIRAPYVKKHRRRSGSSVSYRRQNHRGPLAESIGDRVSSGLTREDTVHRYFLSMVAS